jgi:hypothetical protein
MLSRGIGRSFRRIAGYHSVLGPFEPKGEPLRYPGGGRVIKNVPPSRRWAKRATFRGLISFKVVGAKPKDGRVERHGDRDISHRELRTDVVEPAHAILPATRMGPEVGAWHLSFYPWFPSNS